uniref:Major facilitator superfamily (MFS) profile domain-containing protein n=1 Tax=Plectus sambesii TaxID=2011161 RepID=A0A914WID2_9BILA
GIAFAACMPVVGGVTAKWATLKQNALFLSILTSFLQLAPSVTNPLSGALCTSLGWRSVYYFHGGACFVLFAIFAAFYQNTPKNHPFVGQTELNKLAVGKFKAALNKKAARNVPYLSIFKTIAVWAVWVAAFGNFSGTNLVMLFSPTYLNKVMKFPVEKTGLSAALPPLIQFVVKLISGLTSDKVRCFPETLKVKVYNTIAFFGMAAFFIGLAFVPVEDPMLALALLICGTSLLGFNTGGFYKSATLVSRHYSSFVMSIVQFMVCMTMLIVPILVGAIAPDDTVGQWQIIWFLYAATLIITNIIFAVFGRGVPAWWAQDSDAAPAAANGIQELSIGHSSVAVVPVGMTTDGAKSAF